jgi:hypothetical protein
MHPVSIVAILTADIFFKATYTGTSSAKYNLFTGSLQKCMREGGG